MWMAVGSLTGTSKLGRFRHGSVWIDDEFLGDAFVEIFIAHGRIVELDDRGVDDLGDGQTVVQNGLHQIAVVAENGRLSGEEAVALGPAETETHAEVALL